MSAVSAAVLRPLQPVGGYCSHLTAAAALCLVNMTLLACPVQVNAEIVVTFEGTTEFGNPFMARQSYLMDEVMWGHQFSQIIYKPDVNKTRYRIDFSWCVVVMSPCQLLQL